MVEVDLAVPNAMCGRGDVQQTEWFLSVFDHAGPGTRPGTRIVSILYLYYKKTKKCQKTSGWCHHYQSEIFARKLYIRRRGCNGHAGLQNCYTYRMIAVFSVLVSNLFPTKLLWQWRKTRELKCLMSNIQRIVTVRF